MDVLIKDLPDHVHAELVRRATAEGTSLRAYVRQLLSAQVAVPSMAEWLQRVGDLGPVHHDGGATGVELVGASRAEDDELTGR